MSEQIDQLIIPTLGSIRKLLDPIYSRLENIENCFKQNSSKTNAKSKYYRNSDLRELFGLSSNTIIKYRETGILPYTRLGDIYLYDVNRVDAILQQNSVSL